MTSIEPFVLEELAANITEAAKDLRAYLTSVSSPQGKLASESKPTTPLAGSLNIPPSASSDISCAKRVLFEATTKLQQLVSSPLDYHQSLVMSNNFLACTRWLCTFDVPSHVPEQGSISYTELAIKASVSEAQLSRIARMAMCAGQFHEPSTGQIAHTPLSMALRSSTSTYNAMMFLTEISAPSAQKMVEMTRHQAVQASQSIPESELGKSQLAFNIALSTPLHFYGFLSKNPLHQQRFNSGMKAFSTATESHVKHLISQSSFPWSSLPHDSLIVDMGGSTGHVSFALAAAFPHLQFIIQDLPGVVKSTPLSPEELSTSRKAKFQAHDFFNPQPEENHGAAVFLIRQCLQNWPDEKAALVLRNLIPCLHSSRRNGTNAKIVIMNVVLPDPNYEMMGPREKAIARFRDMLGMQALGSQERDMVEWDALVEMAGSEEGRLEIVREHRPEGSVLSILEVALKS